VTSSVFAAHRLGRVTPHSLRAVQRGFLLISLANPAMDMAAWRRVVRHYRGRAPKRAGLVLIEDQRGFVHAAFRYVVDSSPSLLPGRMPGPVLRVHDLVMLDTGGRALTTAIEERLAEMAADCACRSVWIDPIGRTGA
jgi:hypothetical protein